MMRRVTVQIFRKDLVEALKSKGIPVDDGRTCARITLAVDGGTSREEVTDENPILVEYEEAIS